jgi:hypothetical protein
MPALAAWRLAHSFSVDAQLDVVGEYEENFRNQEQRAEIGVEALAWLDRAEPEL